MGTRGIMGVYVDGQSKLAYNQFDSYPDGVGAELLKELRSIVRRGKLAKYKELARVLSLKTDKDIPTETEIEFLKPHTDQSVNGGSLKDWYVILRELQGKLFEQLKVGYMHDHKQFILDSLFCEWGYIVNFDENTLEVYMGFQTKPHNKGRYAKVKRVLSQKEKEAYGRTKAAGIPKYYPCALVKTYLLKQLPSRKDFVKELDAIAEENV